MRAAALCRGREGAPHKEFSSLFSGVGGGVHAAPLSLSSHDRRGFLAYEQ